MRIDRLLDGGEEAKVKIIGDVGRSIESLCYDSREVTAGSCFFAVVGTAMDGHNFIDMALDSGAVAVVCERLPEVLRSEVSYVVTDDVNRTMGVCSGNLYGNPSREIELIGITGTNGKTTTATLLADLFVALGFKTGLISTVSYRVGEREYTSTHTTPDAIRLNKMLREMVDEGCSYCFMEVSSHAIIQRRIEGLRFRGAIFSNLTHDHLDYHGSFAEYLRAKKQLFDGLERDAFALTNIDDRNGDVMVQNCRGEVMRYSLRRMADFRARVIETHLDGMLLQICGIEVWAQLLGRFNAYNLLAAFGTASLLGFDDTEIVLAISKLRPVSGRFEHFELAGRVVIIDYAHTPDALSSVISTIGELRRDGQRLITVCGCGGDRDRSKRPEMARIAYEGSTISIFTSDNPRSESPAAILDDMIAGVSGLMSESNKWVKIEDRSEAISMAAMLSGVGDIILIAGKGHERYQIVGDERRHFDDKEEAIRSLTR